jgi:hypothetical protein
MLTCDSGMGMGMMPNMPMGGGRGGFGGGLQQGHFNPAFIQGQGGGPGPAKRFKAEDSG